MLAEIQARAAKRASSSNPPSTPSSSSSSSDLELSEKVGNVSCCGAENYGRCGQGKPLQCNVFTPVKLYRCDEDVSFSKVRRNYEKKDCIWSFFVKLDVGAAHAAALSKDGRVFTWGKCHVGSEKKKKTKKKILIFIKVNLVMDLKIKMSTFQKT